MFEKLFKKKGFRVWFSVSVSLIAFMIIAAVVSSIFYDFLRVAIGRGNTDIRGYGIRRALRAHIGK